MTAICEKPDCRLWVCPVAVADSEMECVTHETTVEASIPTVWRALTSQAGISQWLGIVDRPWDRIGMSQLDLGHGDRFEVKIERVDGRRHIIEMWWTYLGVAPRNLLRFSLEETDERTSVHLIDIQAGRSVVDALPWRGLLVMWLERLNSYVRGDLDRQIREEYMLRLERPISNPFFRPLHPEVLYGWLPISGVGLIPNAVYSADADGPVRFELNTWRSHYDDEIEFAIRGTPTDDTATTCRIRLLSSPSSPTLVIEHEGWNASTGLNLRQHLLRERFRILWQASLELAEEKAQSRGG